MSERQFAKVARMRLLDVQVGDVVNKFPDSEAGWFVVAQITRLFNGELQVADFGQDKAVSGSDYDMVGVQFVGAVKVEPQPEIPAELLKVTDHSIDPNAPKVEEEPEENESESAAGDGEAPRAALPASLAGRPA